MMCVCPHFINSVLKGQTNFPLIYRIKHKSFSYLTWTLLTLTNFRLQKGSRKSNFINPALCKCCKWSLYCTILKRYTDSLHTIPIWGLGWNETRNYWICLKNWQVFVRWFCHGMRKKSMADYTKVDSLVKCSMEDFCQLFVRDFESRPWNQFWLEFHLTNQSHF